MSLPRQWIRLYTSVLDDPKIQTLPDSLFRFWIDCLLLCGLRGDSLPLTSHCAFRLRISERQVVARRSSLVSLGLIDETPDGFKMHDWEQYQYDSDSSTGRVKRFRNVSRNAHETVQSRAEEKQSRADRFTAASSSSVASLPSEDSAGAEKHTSTGEERESAFRAREKNHSRSASEKSNLALAPLELSWLESLMARMADIYRQAGLPIAPKHDQLIRQLIVGLDEPTRARVPERLPNYCMWALATGRWKSPATTKSLLNVLREGEWDVPLTPRTLPNGEAQRKPNLLEETEKRFIDRMRAKAQKGA
jgi:hypothetical protein